MTESPEVQAAKEALVQAMAEHARLKRERAAEVSLVDQKWRPAILRAESVVGSAERTLREAESAAAPDHEWTGRKVYSEAPLPRNVWDRGPVKTKRVEGIVQTYRLGVELGRGWYRAPDAGAALVRHLKKDGTPGAKVEFLGPNWKLA